MKRIISVLLALCMVCGFVPVVGASASGEGIKIVYDYAAQMPTGTVYFSDYGEEQLKVFSFESSHELWAYAGYYGGDVRFRNGEIIQLEKNGYWYATEIYVPRDGVYTIEQVYSTYTEGGNLDVYIIPKGNNEKYESSLITDKTPIISQSCVGNDNFLPASAPAKAENVELDAGYYYVVYKANGGRAMFGNLTLNGGDGRAVTEMTVSVPDEMKKGDTGVITTSAYYSDLTSGATVEGDVTYASNNSDILEINATTGEYTAKSGGVVTVTVTAGLISETVEITVYGESGVTVIYDWADQIKKWDGTKYDNVHIDGTHLLQYTFTRSHNLWEYEGCRNLTTLSWRDAVTHDYIQFNRSAGGLWIAFEIYVPKTGWYTLEQRYAKFGGSKSDIGVYMIQKETEVAFDSASDMSDGNEILMLDCKGTSSGAIEEVDDPAKINKYLRKGNYYVAYKQIKTAEGTNVALFGNLTLNGGPGHVFTDITVNVPSELKVGDIGTVTTTAYYSDLESDFGESAVAYASSNTDVLEVDANTGAYTALDEGSAEITISAGDITKTITVTVTSDNPNTITTNPTVSVYIGAENADASLVTVTKGGISAGDINGSVARGTEITATATSNESYQFLYWMDNAKRYIQDDATYTFTAGTNTAIWAVYADKTDGFMLYDYFTDYGTRVYSTEAADEAAVTVPELEMTGYTGGTWKKSIDNDEYVTFTPNWESATKSTVSVTLDGNPYETGSYGDEVTVEKTVSGFISWIKNGKLVSYNDKYTFFAWDDTEAIVQSEDGEKSTFPAVVLFNDGSKYMLELVNCEDVEIIEKGILFDGTIDSCQKKFVSRTALSQFTIVEENLTNAKAYVIYKDGNKTRVAYSAVSD